MEFFQKSLNLILRRQTNILCTAAVIMVTVFFSPVLGLVRQRLLVATFGASNNLGVYLASVRVPDFLFQIIIAGAVSSAFIPVFSDFLAKKQEAHGHVFASSLLNIGLVVFAVISFFLALFADPISHLVAPGFSQNDISLMANLMRIVLIGEMLFIVASFFSSFLQSYNHFFIPGFAAALYNVGMIISILIFSPMLGIYAPAWGVVIGALLFALLQVPFALHVGFRFSLNISPRIQGIKEVFRLMWPRTLSLIFFQLGTLLTLTLVSFLPNAGRNYVVFDYAQTLAFAPVALIGQAIAQAAFPVLSREKGNLPQFKQIFLTSFNQTLYLILPISVLFLVLRIPVVRLVYGASQFDWAATVLTGRTLMWFSVGIFAQALSNLIARGFYALYDTKTPLIVGGVTTLLMLLFGIGSVFFWHTGVIGIAFSYSLAGIVNFLLLFLLLDQKVGGFSKRDVIVGMLKIGGISIFTAFALYIPIKLLDQLVFDTTKTINLLMLTGISATIGLVLYIFLSWVFNVREAVTFLLVIRHLGNWREILTKTDESIESTHVKL